MRRFDGGQQPAHAARGVQWWKVLAMLAVPACATTAVSSDLPPRELVIGTDASTLTVPTIAPTTTSAPAPATTVPPPSTRPSASAPVASSAPPTTSTTTLPPAFTPCPTGGGGKFQVRAPVPFDPPSIPSDWQVMSIGQSALGREIDAIVRPAKVESGRRVLVVGSIHGNEVTSRPTVRNMVTAEVPDDIELWLVPDSNPDGTLLGTRCNANGVDLNRNFSWDWAAYDGGPGPMSEPETQLLASLVLDLEPDLVVWFHQSLRYIGPIGDTDPALAEAWANASGVPLRLGIFQHGGAESWTAFVAGRPSILVEAESRDFSLELAEGHRQGLNATLAVLSDIVAP